MGKSNKQIIASPEEAEVHAGAQALLAQGDAAFGDPQNFDMAADLAEIAGAANMDIEAAKRAAGFSTSSTQPESPSSPAPAVVEPPVQENASVFSDDPEKRFEEIATALRTVDPTSPSVQQLKAWKAQYGEVYITDLENNIFIYRHLNRQEWTQMQLNPDIENMREDQVEEYIYTKCVLWPQKGPIEIAATHAGAVPSIVQQIRIKSMFLDPNYVASVTLKL